MRIINPKLALIVAATIILVTFSLLAVVYTLHEEHQRVQHEQILINRLAGLAHRNSTAFRALCAQRHDLDQRIIITTALLQSHPGVMLFGIPRALIVSGLRRDLTTRKNLEILGKCRPA